MERRDFVQKMILTLGVMLPGSFGCSSASKATSVSAAKKLKGTKSLFLKLGTCSRTLFHIVNREFGHTMELEEKAAEHLAGGILQKGYQCGMLWGSSLAAGAESYRRFYDKSLAAEKAINSTRHLMTSFSSRTQCVNCRDVVNCDVSSKFGLVKCFVSGAFFSCFNLADNWAPEAVESASIGLQFESHQRSVHSQNCASKVAKQMGASEMESVMVSGFAGGMGLSGNACGALAAAVWLKTLQGMREQADFQLDKTRLLKSFYKESGSQILCEKICGQKFETVAEHNNYIEGGGCHKLINSLAQT